MSSRVTVKDIAKELDISIGTVSKALSGKNGISEEMRNNVANKAKEMGYSVNRIAQSLSRRQIKLGIVYPSVWSHYYNEIVDGMVRAIERLRDNNVHGEFWQFSGLYSLHELTAAVDKAIEAQPDAIVLCPGSISEMGDCANRIREHGIKLILVGNDMDGAKRLCSVRLNAFMAGAMAAEFMGYLTGNDASLAVFIGDKGHREHMEKVSAFENQLEEGRILVRVFETQDEPDVAALFTRKLISDLPEIGGIYVATGNSVAVCATLAKLGKTNVPVIATDLFDNIMPYIQSRMIRGIIYQNPGQQGEKAIEVCYRYLVSRVDPDSDIFISPSLLLRSNIL